LTCNVPDKDAFLVGDLPGREGGTVEIDFSGSAGRVSENSLVALVCEWHGDEWEMKDEGVRVRVRVWECEKRG
jgi:hypothetical protein